MFDSRPGAEAEGFPRDQAAGAGQDRARSGGLLVEFVLSGLALILPALAFTGAAFLFYPPAAQAMAPVALGLTLVGIGLVLLGYVLRRR